MKNKAQTLMEVLIAALLLILVSYGLAGLFISGKKHITHSHFRITSAETGRFYLDHLQMDVRQDIVSDPARLSCLKTGTNCPPTQTIDNIVYTPEYIRTPMGEMTKVTLTVKWNEWN